MKTDLEILDGLNRRWARISISEDRMAAVARELDQFADAIEAVRAKIDFFSEPAGLRTAAEYSFEELPA